MARSPKPPDRPRNPRYVGKPPISTDEISLTDFSRRHPDEKEWEEIHTEINQAHDRVVAIILSAQIELYLQHLLMSLFPHRTVDEMFSVNKPLSSFEAKIHFASAMRLIPEEMEPDLNVIRRLRNAFAHAPSTIRFSDPPVAKELKKISFHPVHKIRGKGKQIGGVLGKLYVDMFGIDGPSDRDVFIFSTASLSVLLLKALEERLSHIDPARGLIAETP
jgi:hypothetical protein